MQELLKRFDNCTTIEMKRYVFEEIYMNKEKCVNLKHKYTITQNANTGYWQTYIISETGKRKLVRKKNREDLYDALCSFYFPAPVTTSISDLYPIWLDHKEKVSKCSNTIYRIDMDWIRFFKKDKISTDMITRDISTLSKNDLLEWMCYLIDTYDLKKKSYNNMSIIPRSIFTYAFDNDMLDTNNFAKVKIPSHLFVRDYKPESETQVFTRDEQIALCDTAIDEYYTGRQNVFLFNVPLIFLTGLRIGEVIALKWNDVKEDHLLIHSSLKRDLVRSDDGWLPATYNVHDSLKKNAPPRKVPLATETKRLLVELRSHYEKTGKTPTYVFEKSGKIATEGALNAQWKRLCRKIDIPPRSPHKGRKTFVTTLIDYRLPIHYVCEVSGHADEQTTYKHYCFTRDTKAELLTKVDRALTCTVAS